MLIAEKPSILIIDDDVSILRTLAKIFQRKGYFVAVAEKGKEAIEKINSNHFDVALIDLCLPDMEGIELLSKLRETKPKMRKIIITGYPTLQNAVGAVNQGADAYVMKPFDVEKMLKTIKEQLKKQNEERSFSEMKVAEFIETRVKELETIDQQAIRKPR